MRDGLLVVSVSIPLVVVFWPVQTVGFHGDDYGLGLLYKGGKLTGNNVLDALSSGWGGLSGWLYYRPLTSLFLLPDFYFFGADKLWFHFHSLLLHLTCVVLVAVLLRVLSPGVARWRMAAAGLFFGLHPAAVGVLATVVNRMDSRSAIALGLALIAFIKYRRTGRRSLLFLALGMETAGFGIKESMIALPVLFLVVDLSRKMCGKPTRGIGICQAALAFGSVVVVYLAVRFLSVGPTQGAGYVAKTFLSPSAWEHTVCSYATALLLVVLPINCKRSAIPCRNRVESDRAFLHHDGQGGTPWHQHGRFVGFTVAGTRSRGLSRISRPAI